MFLYIHFKYRKKTKVSYGQNKKLLNVPKGIDIESRHLTLKHSALSDHLALLQSNLRYASYLHQRNITTTTPRLFINFLLSVTKPATQKSSNSIKLLLFKNPNFYHFILIKSSIKRNQHKTFML